MNIYELDEMVKKLKLNVLKNTNLALKQFPNSPIQLETRKRIKIDTDLINYYERKRPELLKKIEVKINEILNNK